METAVDFSGTEDWIFAARSNLETSLSSTGHGKSWSGHQRRGIGHVSSHAFRHTYRSWLDAVKTPIAVQQKMMRHTDIRTTMNIYGDVVLMK